jgi:cytochrome P450
MTLIYGTMKDSVYTRICNTFSPPFSHLLYYLKPDSGVMAHIAQFRFSADRAKERMALGATDRADFMSYILRHNDEKGMSVAEIESNASLLVIAGSETTASYLAGITYNLLLTPDVLARLTKEIRNEFERQEDITVTKLTQMDYLTACVEEGLRTYPPIPNGGQPRRTTKGGNVIAGQYVPEETTVSMLAWGAYYSPKHFKDPKKFVPERWLSDEKGEYSACEGRYRDDNRKALQPFSVGPRNCLGKK